MDWPVSKGYMGQVGGSRTWAWVPDGHWCCVQGIHQCMYLGNWSVLCSVSASPTEEEGMAVCVYVFKCYWKQYHVCGNLCDQTHQCPLCVCLWDLCTSSLLTESTHREEKAAFLNVLWSPGHCPGLCGQAGGIPGSEQLRKTAMVLISLNIFKWH